MNFIRRGHYTPFLLGLLIGGAVVLSSVLIFDQVYDSRLREAWGTWTILVGTLLTGIFAGWAALQSARAQINQVQELENQRNSAKLRAARATLSVALVEFSAFAKYGALASVNPTHVREVPMVGLGSINTLKEVIEHADPISIRWLAAILALHQVFSSRQKNENSKLTTPGEWLLLHSAIGHCFGYARFSNGCDQIPEHLGGGWRNLPDWSYESAENEISQCQEQAFKRSLEKWANTLSGTLREFEGGMIMNLEKREEAR
ncbi:hypothetical protein KUV39_07995 [Phaeobacter italicus]|uniref:hypothetical protein n=1 Tax=Phaeobacter italicus TaxID=481446 RepID=UPI001C94DCB3|nr:hypothetical protein [Phaeobacter italicus]MBY5976583.1 hypothetical protein [Phaeobacter italicus]